MVTSFSKLLFYSAVIYWSSSLCFDPTVKAADCSDGAELDKAAAEIGAKCG